MQLGYVHTHRIKPMVCVMYLTIDRYDVCDVTLSVYPHRTSLTNMPGQGGNRTYDLWNTTPMLCQLSYALRSVRVSDISIDILYTLDSASNDSAIQKLKP